MAVRIAEEGFILQYVPAELKTPELCNHAVKKYGYAIIDVPEELKTFEMCEIAFVGISSYDHDWKDKSEFLKTHIPEEFQDELAEKYDISLDGKYKGR